jgi:glycosyltransferase involved in cell wall biosynthesis
MVQTNHSLPGRSIRVVARTNGHGVDRSVRILLDAFGAWRERPAFSHYRSINPLRRFVGRRNPHECIIFMERITARWLRRAGCYILIPNQERYPERLVPLLRQVDHIFCKTRHATEIFAALHPSVRHLGFTSVDRLIPAIEPDYDRFFHLAGGSSVKGTPVLLEVWSRHPEWPELTVVWHRREAPERVPANVKLIREYLPDSELKRLQNQHGVHLCPSSSEGWGNYIVEAMSCRAAVLATDGPPMNELVRPGRGVLVPYDHSEPRKLGFDFHVEPGALESAIAALIQIPAAEKARLGDSARDWFERNDHAFQDNLRRLVTELIPGLAN